MRTKRLAASCGSLRARRWTANRATSRPPRRASQPAGSLSRWRAGAWAIATPDRAHPSPRRPAGRRPRRAPRRRAWLRTGDARAARLPRRSGPRPPPTDRPAARRPAANPGPTTIAGAPFRSCPLACAAWQLISASGSASAGSSRRKLSQSAFLPSAAQPVTAQLFGEVGAGMARQVIRRRRRHRRRQASGASAQYSAQACRGWPCRASIWRARRTRSPLR
jgi:hypothetical protein